MEGVARQTHDKLGGAGVAAGIGQSNLVVNHAHVRGGILISGSCAARSVCK